MQCFTQINWMHPPCKTNDISVFSIRTALLWRAGSLYNLHIDCLYPLILYWEWMSIQWIIEVGVITTNIWLSLKYINVTQLSCRLYLNKPFLPQLLCCEEESFWMSLMFLHFMKIPFCKINHTIQSISQNIISLLYHHIKFLKVLGSDARRSAAYCY